MTSSSVLEDLAHNTTNFAIAALLLAVMTAIFMQALYEMGLRASLQRNWVSHWIEHRLGFSRYQSQFMKKFIKWIVRLLSFPNGKNKGFEIQDKIDAILKRLEGEGRESSIYSLNYQQLCGQLASTLQSEIEELREVDLLRIFALGMPKEELGKLHSMFDDAPYGETDRKAPSTKRQKELSALRERVSFYVEKGVDDLQIYLGRLWRRNNYLLNILFSVGLTLFLSLLSTQFQFRPTETTWMLLSVGCAGGLVAPIASHLLERLFYPR